MEWVKKPIKIIRATFTNSKTLNVGIGPIAHSSQLTAHSLGSDTTDVSDFVSDYGQLFWRSDSFRLLAIVVRMEGRAKDE